MERLLDGLVASAMATFDLALAALLAKFLLMAQFGISATHAMIVTVGYMILLDAHFRRLRGGT